MKKLLTIFLMLVLTLNFSLGYLLNEDFESYSNNTEADNFVGYTSFHPAVIGETFKVYDDGINKFYRVDASSSELFTEYNGINALNWENYEISGRMRATENKSSSWDFGVFFATNFSNSKFYKLHTDYINKNFRFRWSMGTELSNTEPYTYNFILVPEIEQWYKFRIVFTYNDSTAYIYGKVWEEGESEPSEWVETQSTFNYNFNYEGSIGFSGRDCVADFDDIIVKNIINTPEITIHSPINTIYNKQEILINISVNVKFDLELDTILYEYDNINYTYNEIHNKFFDRGNHTIKVYVNDSEGNTANEEITFEVKIIFYCDLSGVFKSSINENLNFTLVCYSQYNDSTLEINCPDLEYYDIIIFDNNTIVQKNYTNNRSEIFSCIYELCNIYECEKKSFNLIWGDFIELTCPDSTEQLLLWFMLLSLCLFFIIISLYFKLTAIGFFIGLMMFYLGFKFMYCDAVLGSIITGFAILFIILITMIWGKND